MSATGDDNALWAHIGSLGAGLLAIGGLLKWLLGKIDAVAIEAKQERLAGEAELRAEIREVMDRLEDHHKEATKFREHVISLMVTRPELERQLDRQTENVVSRLDARIMPLIETKRRGG